MADFKLNLDEQFEISVQNDFTSYDEEGNEVRTFRKENFTLRQLYQLKNSASSTLTTIQSRIDFIESEQVRLAAIAENAIEEETEDAPQS